EDENAKNKPCLSSGGVWLKDNNNRLILVESISGYFNTDEKIGEAVAGPMSRYPLQYTAIEDANGMRWLEREIKRCAEAVGVKNPAIIYLKVDKAENAKRRRIALIPSLMEQKLMVISDACVGKEFVREQLSKYTEKKRSPMDVADMFGLTAIHLGGHMPLPVEEMSESEYGKKVKVVQERAMREILFPTMDDVVYEQALVE